MMKRVLATITVTGLAFVFPISPGMAEAAQCSEFHGPIDARRALFKADAAVIGIVESIRAASSEVNQQIWKLKIDQAVKGRIPSIIEVHMGSVLPSPTSGERVGLLLFRSNQPWWDSGSGCRLEPERLLRAAEPLPPPDGTNPAVLLMGGSFGEARALALDAAGRTLAYGAGNGSTMFFSICPGQKRVVELVRDRNGIVSRTSLAVRDLTSLTVIREQSLPELDRSSEEERGPEVGSVSCRDQQGEDVLMWILKSVPGDADSWESRIMRIRPAESRDLLKGQFGGVEFVNSGTVAYANSGGHDRGVFRLDLARGTTTRIAGAPVRGFGGSFALSPEGRRLAWALSGRYLQTDDHIVVFDLSTTPVSARRVTMNPNFSGLFAWVDNRTLAVGRVEDESIPAVEVRTYDQQLRIKGKFGGWQGWHIHAALNGSLYGAGGKDSLLVQARISNGDPQTLRSFDPFSPGTIVSLPSGINLAAAGIESSKITGEIIETLDSSPTPEPRQPRASSSKDTRRTNYSFLVVTALLLLMGILALLWRSLRKR